MMVKDLRASLMNPSGPMSETLNWATEVGIPGALALLAKGLAFEGENGSSAEFVGAFLDAVEGGQPLDRVAHLWVTWAWGDAAEPLGTRIGSPAARAACEAVVDLHRRTAAGEAIQPKDWRGARRNMATAQTADAREKRTLDVIAASAWDYETVPGASQDMLLAWQGMIRQDWEADEGWTSELDDRAAEEARAIMEAVKEEAGNPPCAEDARAQAAHQEQMQKIFQRMVEGDPTSAIARRSAMFSASIRSMIELARNGRAGLLGIMRQRG